MLNALAARLLTLPLVLAVAALALIAPHVATPAHAFEIEKQDWDGYETLPEELPEEYLDTLACAEAGDSECQVEMARIWGGEEDPDIWNPGEFGRWAQAAALQGHRRGMVLFKSYLCVYAPGSKVDRLRYAVEATAWARLRDADGHRPPRVMIHICAAALLFRDDWPDEFDAVIEAGERRAEELREIVPHPLHGSYRWGD